MWVLLDSHDLYMSQVWILTCWCLENTSHRTCVCYPTITVESTPQSRCPQTNVSLSIRLRLLSCLWHQQQQQSPPSQEAECWPPPLLLNCWGSVNLQHFLHLLLHRFQPLLKQSLGTRHRQQLRPPPSLRQHPAITHLFHPPQLRPWAVMMPKALLPFPAQLHSLPHLSLAIITPALSPSLPLALQLPQPPQRVVNNTPLMGVSAERTPRGRWDPGGTSPLIR